MIGGGIVGAATAAAAAARGQSVVLLKKEAAEDGDFAFVQGGNLYFGREPGNDDLNH